jgi:hypothetical protein
VLFLQRIRWDGARVHPIPYIFARPASYQICVATPCSTTVVNNILRNSTATQFIMSHHFGQVAGQIGAQILPHLAGTSSAKNTGANKSGKPAPAPIHATIMQESKGSASAPSTNPGAHNPGLMQSKFSSRALQAGATTTSTNATGSSNNFINFTMGQNLPLTNGEQIESGSANPIPMGVIAAKTNIPSSKFVFPPNGEHSGVDANKPFTISLKAGAAGAKGSAGTIGAPGTASAASNVGGAPPKDDFNFFSARSSGTRGSNGMSGNSLGNGLFQVSSTPNGGSTLSPANAASTAQHSTAQHSTVQHNTAQPSTARPSSSTPPANAFRARTLATNTAAETSTPKTDPTKTSTPGPSKAPTPMFHDGNVKPQPVIPPIRGITLMHEVFHNPLVSRFSRTTTKCMRI